MVYQTGLSIFTPRQFCSSLREGGQVDCCTVASASRLEETPWTSGVIGILSISEHIVYLVCTEYAALRLLYTVYCMHVYTAYLYCISILHIYSFDYLFTLSPLCTACSSPSCPCLSKLLDHNVKAT